jgi:Tol biopolymer transport system component
LAVAATLVVAAVYAIATIPAGPSDRTGVPGQSPSISTPSGRTFVDLETGATEPLPDGIPHGTFYAVSPDGTMVATNPCCSSVDPVWIVNIDGTGLRPITEGEMDGYGARWSPDGSMLVFQGRDGSTEQLGDLFVVDVATGDRTRVTDLDRTDLDRGSYGLWFLSPSFTPDGRSILFHLPRGSDRLPARWDLWSVPIDGGEPTLVRRDASMGAYAPDGTLAYLDPSPGDWSSPTLSVSGAGGGPPRVVAEGDEIAFPRWSPDGTRIAYVDGGAVYVVDVATGETSRVADGGWGEWFDEDTLIIGPD